MTPNRTGFPTSLNLKACDHQNYLYRPNLKTQSLKDQGTKPDADQPNGKLVPNMRALASSNGLEALSAISSASKGLSPSALRIFSILINGSAAVKSRGFYFGQTVYFNLSAPKLDNLECYRKAEVMACESEDPESLIYLLSSMADLNDANPVYLELLPSEILTKEQFKVKKKQLTKDKKVKLSDVQRKKHAWWEDPSRGQPISDEAKSALAEADNVPTINHIDAQHYGHEKVMILDPLEQKKKKKVKSSKSKKV